MVFLQVPAQAQNLTDSLVEAKSNIVVKVSYSNISHLSYNTNRS